MYQFVDYNVNGVYPSDYFYSEKIVGLLKELSKEKDINFGQQGFAHYCKECFKEKENKDPWHENMCLYKKPLLVREQTEFMKKGKNVIEDVLEVSPIIYDAPNIWASCVKKRIYFKIDSMIFDISL